MARTARRRTFIKEWRQHRSLTLEQLAEKVGTTHGTLSRIEHGKIHYRQTMLEAIAEALDVEPGDLLSRNPLDPADELAVLIKSIPKTDMPRVIGVLKALR